MLLSWRCSDANDAERFPHTSAGLFGCLASSYAREGSTVNLRGMMLFGNLATTGSVVFVVSGSNLRTYQVMSFKCLCCHALWEDVGGDRCYRQAHLRH